MECQVTAASSLMNRAAFVQPPEAFAVTDGTHLIIGRQVKTTDNTAPQPLSAGVAGASSEHDLRRRFLRLAKKWRNETAFLSSLQDKFLHPTYQQIIGMGPAAIPLITKELQARPDYWFWAIDAIVGKPVLPPNFNGGFKEMVTAYVTWGNSFKQ